MKTIIFCCTIVLALFIANKAPAQGLSSYSSCYAYTSCPNGGSVYCQVYGSAHVYGPGNTSSACTWYVRPWVGVHCSGFAQARNIYGQFVWGWQNYEFYCH